MATLNSFPNNADEYIGAEEVMRWLHGRTSGVYGADGNAAVTAVANSMAVSVAAGIGWLNDAAGNGIVWWFNAAQELTIDPAEATGTLNRIDRIVIQWRTVDYADKPELVVLKGTSASSAVAPALTNSGTLRQISLARVSIPAGTTEITNMLITDERFDTSVCGIVTETVTADTSMIHNQYLEAVEMLESAISQAWGGVISDGAISASKIVDGAVSEYYTAIIPTGWNGSDPYIQTVTINGILATDHPIIDLLPSDTYSDVEDQIDAWGLLYKVVATANTLTFYATDEPTVAIPIQVRCIRK